EVLVQAAVEVPGVDAGAGPRAGAVDVQHETAGLAGDGVAVAVAGLQPGRPQLRRGAEAGELVDGIARHVVGGEALPAAGVDDLVAAADRYEVPDLVGAAVECPLVDRRAVVVRGA